MWILLEGLDRSGKSSVAEHYKKQGYRVVHMGAPDSKYFNPDYSGESYLEEVVRMYSQYDNQDVVFDRTVWGELVWPNIFGRQALLNEEDLEYLSAIERNNEASKILMYDANTEAHWQRCVDNNEPLNRQQFGRASVFYERLESEFGFIKKQLTDFPEIIGTSRNNDGDNSDSLQKSGESVHELHGNPSNNGINNGATVGTQNVETNISQNNSGQNDIEQKLEKANAIRNVLSGKIIKKKGEIYEHLDTEVKKFLQKELDNIFTPKEDNAKKFNDQEVAILKLYCERLLEKAK